MRKSFSQWESYDDCPQQWKFRYVDRLPRLPAGPAAQRGQDVHDSIAAYINGGLETVLHPCIKPDYINVFDKYRSWDNGDRWTEREFGLTDDWGWTAPKSPDCRLIAITDVIASINNLVDCGEWKSGKPKTRHRDQRTLYAAVGLTWWPKATQATVTTHYVEGTAPSERLVVKRESHEKVIKIWNQRFDEMDRNKICAPRPGFYCNWCSYSREKDGPCKVG